MDEDSPFRGTRTFGLNFAFRGALATAGTALRISEFDTLPDGRLYVSSRGGQRYRVLRVIKEQPVLLCEIEWLSDEADVQPEGDLSLAELADDVRQLFITTLMFSNKQKGDDRETDLSEELGSLTPTELSFWLMRIFGEHPTEQQKLLEMTSCRERLLASQVVLRETCSYLSATSAIKNAMSDIERGME